MEITKLKQVETIAQEYFKCTAAPLKGEEGRHAKGYRGVKLMVGWKANVAYNPNIDPNNPPEQYSRQPDLLKNVINPKTPDIRIIWVEPGMSDKELREKLINIKKSLEAPKPIEQKDNTITKIGGESDADLAARYASGDLKDSRFDEFEEGYEEEDEFLGDGMQEKTTEEITKKEPEQETSSQNDDILNAINQLAENMTTISDDIGKLDSKIDEIDQRLLEVEDTNKPKKKGRPKKE